MDSKGSTSFLAVVAASVLSLAATAGEDEVLLDVATNYAQNVGHARCLTAAEAKKAVDEVFTKAPVYQKPGRAERVWVRDPEEEDGIYSSASSCHIRRAAEMAVKGFSARKEGPPVKIGVFYDPMASVPRGEMEKIYQDADPGLYWSAKYELTEKRGRELAGKKLVAQIEAFFRHLANAPDSSSHRPLQ